MTTGSRQTIKCLVWDLDHTLWSGILAEGDELAIRPGVADCLRELDKRGILLSIASRNDPEEAMSRLTRFGLAEYFLAPQIGWNAKSASVAAIAKALNIGLDAIAFIDDDAFELAEVASSHPEVRCFSADSVAELPDHQDFHPKTVTIDASRRRQMYREDAARRAHEANYTSASPVFLRDLRLAVDIDAATAADLDRAEELTLRTHQLNATGYIYSRDELERLCTSPDHLLIIIGLKDRFGDYGRVGLALLERTPLGVTLRLLLFSCRVLSRGVSGLLLAWLADVTRQRALPRRSEFIPNARNRPMLLALRFAGFEVIDDRGTPHVLELAPSRAAAIPDYFQLQISPQVIGRFDDFAARSEVEA